MPPTVTGPRGPTARDWGWAAFAVMSALLALPAVLSFGVNLGTGRWSAAATAAVMTLVAYWFAAGAFRRTVWGRGQTDASPDAGGLSPRTAGVYIGVAAATGMLVIAAVALQVMMA